MQPLTTVLHLEDSDLDADLISDRLHRSGLPLRVERVSDRAGFVARLLDGRYGLILADYQVPGFEGLAALELARKYQPDTPFIFVSGTLGEEVAIETLKQGATDYVLKERLTRLIPAVRRALADAHSAAAQRQTEQRCREGEEQLRRQNERLRLLWEAAGVLLSADDPEAMMRGLFDKVGRHLGLDSYFNYGVNEAADGLCLVSYSGVPDEVARSMGRVAFGEGICGAVALNRRSAVVDHMRQSTDPDAEAIRRLGIRAYACIPLLAGNRLLGTLFFGSRSKDRFDNDELEFLETISHYVAVACERVRFIAQLREDDRRKDEFLAMLAHELRNPLAPIRNALQILKLSDCRREGDKARQVMERQLTQMVRLIDDLLDISRVTRGKLELRRERVELAAVVNQAVETVRTHIEGSLHKLAVDLPGQPLYLHADPVRLAQILANLLNNSAKYTEPGGHIQLRAEVEGNDVVIAVRDDGIGIPAAMLPKVFEMFTQVDRSIERSQGGLGIGLTLVKSLVELHGGSVEARSEGAGRGSEFVIRLPDLVGAQQAPTTQDGPVAAPARRVLVVDDNRDGADSLAMVLRLMGNKVQTAYDGIEAVSAAEAFRPKVVLLDIGMPKLNGHEAARRIRGKPWGKGMVIVAVTGWGQEEDKRRSLEAGCDYHLVKPVNAAELERLLAQLVPA